MRPLIAFALMCASMTTHATCDAPENRHFDFWIGEWTVTMPDGLPNAGKLLGHSRIESIAGACGLLENWTGASGVQGKSLNGWDAPHKVWRQFWVGGDGTVLRLEGALQGKAMVLQGEMPTAKGGVQVQRVTWTPADDGSVTQHWQTSDDAGATWATSFLGVYRRAAAK